jgi:group I intron endonuclease
VTIGVYQIKNTITDYIYVGSSANIERRWTTHRYYLKRGTHKNDLLQAAWNEYGLELFNWSILHSVGTIVEARELEQKLLDQIKCEFIPTYNLCFDGKGAILTERSRHKISLALRGRKFTEEHRRKISKGITGRYYSAETRAKIGVYSAKRIHSDVTKAKIGASLRGHHFGPYKNSDLTTRSFINVKTGMSVKLPTYEMRVRYNLDKTCFSRLIKGKAQRCGAWKLL